MLAPLNFGSHLAHKGKHFLGRALKGLSKNHPFEVGEKLLNGLELASKFTWDLAMSDCFAADPVYHPDNIITTILIGDSGYDGFAAVVNQPGSDGTVPIASANLEPVKLSIYNDGRKHTSYDVIRSTNNIAFGILSGVNHSAILTTNKKDIISSLFLLLDCELPI